MISLVVEEVLPGDKFSAIQKRVIAFLEKGITCWLVDYEERAIVVHRTDQGFKIFEIDEEITGEGVVPNGRFQVADFFNLPGD